MGALLRSCRQEGVRRCELNTGDEKSQGARLPDASEDVQADLNGIPCGPDAGIADGSELHVLVSIPFHLSEPLGYKAYTTRKMTKVTKSGAFMSL